MPFDVLLTAENINICFYSIVKSQIELLFWAHFIQPHICLIVHERLQKFDLSIFDFELKRSTDKINYVNGNVPEKSHFLTPIIETKPGEQNTRTGILSSFFSLKMQNFASLFCRSDKTTLCSIMENDSEGTALPSIPRRVVCVCNECLRCYEFNANKVKSFSGSDGLTTSLLIERPVRCKANFTFYKQVCEFLASLEEFKNIEKQHGKFKLTLEIQ